MSPTQFITQKETAARLGVTERQIRNYVLEGFPKEGEGRTAKHPWPASREWYNEYIRAQERKHKPEDDLKDLRRRRQEADTRLAEISVEKAEGELIPFSMHEQRVTAICDRIRSALMIVPSKNLSPILQARTDVEAQAVGEAIRDDILRALRGTVDDIDEDVPDEDAEVSADVA